MSGFVGVLVSDPWLQSQFTQVELRGLKSKVSDLKVLFNVLIPHTGNVIDVGRIISLLLLDSNST